MKILKQLKNIAVIICALAMSLSAAAASRVSGGDKHLLYTGRIDYGNPEAPQMSWPGSSIAGNFTGKYLSIILDDQFGNNYFNVFIDGNLHDSVVIHAEKGEKTYTIAENLAPGHHSFLVTKRTEGGDGATTIKGFDLADGEGLLLPPQRPQRRIEFFGDSITSGMGNEAADDRADNFAGDKNNFMAYDAITARNLDAELHVISQSGIGVMISWLPFTMPQYYDQLNAVGDNNTAWDFSRWKPDVVVINLFQNDSWLIDRERRMNPVPTGEQRVQAYVDFVRSIRSKYPSAFIVCALGSMEATKAGSKWPEYVATAVERMRRENRDHRIERIVFEYTGYAGHPRVKEHEAMAAKLTAFIMEKLGW